MQEDKLEQIFNEIQKDFALSVLNVAEKAKLCPTIKSTWIYRLVREEAYLKKLKDLHADMIAQITSLKKKNNNFSMIKEKIESIKQEDILTVNKQITEQEEVVKFLRLALDTTIKGFSFDIKNVIEQTKLEAL